jgi:predicted Zn-dependent peptidase
MAREADRRAGRVEKTVLPNGLRVLTEQLDHVDSASIGLWTTAGSVDEAAELGGTTHFLEHMLFKGTADRSAIEIGEAIDDLGGQVNGFSEREFVYLHARTVAEQMPAALNLLFALLLDAACPEEEIAREKDVVLQEIQHLEDVPEGWMHDLLPQTAWAGHALGRPVMGTRESVSGLARDQLLDRLAALRAADRLMVTAAGRLEHERVVDLAARACGELKPGGARAAREPPAFHPERRLIAHPAGQVHFCLATPGCSRRDESRHALAVLDTILGGGNSSRLFQEIREKRGLAYNIGSYLQSHSDAGLFVIDAGTAEENFQLVLDLIDGEMARLREDGPSKAELARAKTQLKVSIALAAESTGFRMQHLAGSELYWGRVLSLDEILAGLERVAAEDVAELARPAFAQERRALVAIGPFDQE